MNSLRLTFHVSRSCLRSLQGKGAIIKVSKSAGKILLIASEFPPNVGGIGNHAYNLAKSLTAEGYSVTVIADLIGINETELEAFEKQLHFKVNWIKRKGFVLQTYLQRIVRTVQLSGKAEMVICSGKFSLWLGILIRIFFSDRELIAVVHGSELDLRAAIPKKVTAYSLTKFNKIISVSKYTEQFLSRSLSPNIMKFVIHNGINCNDFIPTACVQVTGDPALITVGSVTERKGQENVINAMPYILSVYPHACYHIIGKPVIKPQLQRMAAKLQLSSFINFHGAVSREELLKKLSSARIKLMLSNHTVEGDFEGFGIAVLEANYYGVPVIGSLKSGIADAIENNKTGILVDPHEPAEVVKAVKAIMNNYSFFSENAKRWAVQHDWRIIVKEYVEALNA